MGKKRKVELDLDMERTMYSSFVQAANAVSQLYTQGVQQQRRAATAATRATVEKVVTFVLRQNEGSETISKAALLQFLQHEYENADSCDAPTPQPTMQLMPFQQAGAAAAEEGSDTHSHMHKAHRQLSGNAMMTSPIGRTASAGRAMGLEEQQQQQQQQLQQQQLQHQLQQQQQQQQHVPLQAAEAMQLHGSMMHMSGGGPYAGHMQQGMGPNMFMASSAAASGMH